MKKNRIIKKSNIKLRYNILTVITYLVGIVLIIQLFNLQIVHGAEYREESNTRLTRETKLEAARGAILDRTGEELVTTIIQLFNLQIVHGAEYREESNTRLTRETKLEAARGAILDRTGEELVTTNTRFGLELYKTKIEENELNNSILNIINVLEKYEAEYVDSFPVNVDPFEYTIEGEELAKWKKNNKLDENATPEEAFYHFKDRYEIQNSDIYEVRKIIAIRYEITISGYSSTRALKISKNIPREAVAEFAESGDKFPGINIVVEPVREYTSGMLASHILGYASKISAEEYKEKSNRYSQNDIIGKNGIEYVFEDYLKGQNGTKQIDMAVDGTITSEYTSKEAIAGCDVVLTLDSNLQRITEQALEKNGTKQIDMAVDGTITSEYTSKEAIAGCDVVLTLDSNLQRITEQALESNIKKIASGGFGKTYPANAGSCVVMNVNTGEVLDSNLQRITEQALESNIKKIASGGFGKTYPANAGSCVVMNVNTGEVLAMASYPNYNPADFIGGISNENWARYRDDSAKPLMNKAIQNAYAPGSIFKMVTAIAGLESGVITRTEQINDTGEYKKYGLKWPCWYYTDYHRGHGFLNVSGAIEKSCNYFFYETGDRMGIETLAKYARYFGLGVKTGIELPSEAKGAVATPEYAAKVGVDWTKGQTINAAIGQGLNAFSPLQMTKYISMLANGHYK